MIYASSTAIHAHNWRRLRSEGWPIVSSWIDGPKSIPLQDRWVRRLDEVNVSWVLLLYRLHWEYPPADALVEAGAALANNVPVFAVGCEEMGFIHHPLVIVHQSLDDALEDIRQRVPFEQQLNLQLTSKE